MLNQRSDTSHCWAQFKDFTLNSTLAEAICFKPITFRLTTTTVYGCRRDGFIKNFWGPINFESVALLVDREQ